MSLCIYPILLCSSVSFNLFFFFALQFRLCFSSSSNFYFHCFMKAKVHCNDHCIILICKLLTLVSLIGSEIFTEYAVTDYNIKCQLKFSRCSIKGLAKIPIACVCYSFCNFICKLCTFPYCQQTDNSWFCFSPHNPDEIFPVVTYIHRTSFFHFHL
jgi:hypothetical protein